VPALACAKRGSNWFFERFLNNSVGFSRDHPYLQGFHPQRLEKLPDLGGLALEPGEFLDLACRRGYRGWRMFPEIARQLLAMLFQLALRPMEGDLTELLKAACRIRLQITPQGAL
jgi:hypothetical protein